MNRFFLNRGIGLALMTAVISGFAVFFNKFVISFWSDSSVFTSAKNLVATLLLIGILLFFRKFSELKKLHRCDWLALIGIGFIGGFIPFLLFFKGLSMISAVSAAFIHKTLFIWVAALAIIFLKEKIRGWALLALTLLALSISLMGGVSGLSLGRGELLVFLAVLFWSAENIWAKIVLRKLSSVIVGFGRMFFGSMFLLAYLVYTGRFGELLITPHSGSFWWLILSGILLFGYVITWYEALKYAPATAVSAILVLAVPVTIILDSLFAQKNLSVLSLIIIGLSLISFYLLNKVYGSEKLLFRPKTEEKLSSL